MNLFNSVIGHLSLKNTLSQIIQHNTMGHAYLFIGKEGSGALPLALSFAKLLVSLPPQANYNIENIIETNVYKRANSLTHPDLHFIYPTIKKKDKNNISSEYIKEFRSFIQENPYNNYYQWLQYIEAENKQGNIPAEECNEIGKIVSIKPYESKYKVLLIWMPELLGKEGNKLLKIIEEPPANTIFLLVAERKELILETILSRCQIIQVSNYSNSEIIDGLTTLYQIPTEQATQIAAIVEGNFNTAISLIHNQPSEWLELIKNWLNFTITNNIEKQIILIEEMATLGREKQKQLLIYFLHLIELTVRIHITNNNHLFSNQDEQVFVEKLSKLISFQQKKYLVELINNNIYFIERNANAKILFQAFSIQIFHLINKNELISV